jgi:hypothetical protein
VARCKGVMKKRLRVDEHFRAKRTTALAVFVIARNEPATTVLNSVCRGSQPGRMKDIHNGDSF